MRVVYFGTGLFAVAPLQHLFAAKGAVEVVAVVTRPDRPVGRKQELQATPVATAARAHGATLLQPATLKDDAIFQQLADLKADVFIVASYGRIVPQRILDLPPLGALNLHGSLLPAYRGASPIQAAIAAGDAETGVSLMKMDAEVDHGPVYATASCPIEDSDTHDTLEQKLGDVAATLLLSCLQLIANGTLLPMVQEHALATFTKIIDKEDGKIRWTEQTAAQIERLRRAYTPWPGIFTTIPTPVIASEATEGSELRLGKQSQTPKRLKLLDVAIDPSAPAIAPGTTYLTPEGLPAIRAKDQGLILTKVQPEGKPPMDGKAFLNGHKDFAGKTLA